MRRLGLHSQDGCPMAGEARGGTGLARKPGRIDWRKRKGVLAAVRNMVCYRPNGVCTVAQQRLVFAVLPLTDATGADVDVSAASVTGGGTDTLTCDLSGVALPDGYYTATLSAAHVQDLGGKPMAGNQTFQFHVLKGDATGDAKTNVFDLLKVHQNYLKPAGDLARDDNADITGDGHVNIFDLLLLKRNYLRDLEKPGGGAAGGTLLTAERLPQEIPQHVEEPTPPHYAELSVPMQDSDGGPKTPLGEESGLASDDLSDFTSFLSVADLSPSAEETQTDYAEPLSPVAPHPVAQTSDAWSSADAFAEDDLVDVLAVPSLDVALGV